jgi:hypothetical protein
MSSPRPNGRQIESASVLPEEVATNLDLADKHCRAFLELTAQATALDPEIAAAQATLDKLKARHSQYGADGTKQESLAKAYHEMALDRCKKYGYGPMPVPFDDMVTALAQQVERIGLVATGGMSDTMASPAAKPDPLTDAAFRAVS